MTEKFIPNPANYVMKGNKPQPAPVEPATPDMPDLATLTAEELRNLLKRLFAAVYGIGMMTPDEIAEAFKLKLAIGGMTEKDMFKALPLMREWFDREKGKAAQSISLDVADKRMDKLPIDRLLKLASMLDEPVIISPLHVDKSVG